jgi:branched-chain amino acid transport system substrate-binding protein
MPRIAMARRAGTAFALLGLVSLVAAGCGSSSKGGGNASPSGSAASSAPAATAAVLGTPNKATGTPIKLGFVNDGASQGINNSGYFTTAQTAVKYANDYLGGLNGHVLSLDHCETGNTPSGATACGVQMVKDNVATVLVATSAQDHSIFAAIGGKIPYVTGAAADTGILLSKGGFVLDNSLGGLGAGLASAKQAGAKKAGIIVIDVPAATGPIKALADPYYKKAGITLDLIPISASVADQTPQIQQAIARGDGQFTITGTNDFDGSALKALKQLGFKGPTLTALTPFPKSVVDNVPGGVEGVINAVSVTDAPTDKDVQVYNAASQKYNGVVSDTGTTSQLGYAVVLSFVKALTGVTTAIDATSIQTALSSMPKPVPLVLGGGITFQCGSKPFAIIPNVCSSTILVGTLKADGTVTKYEVVDTKSVLSS